VALPLDNEDYLVPSPQSPPPATPNSLNNNKNPYMDLISDGKSTSGMFIYPPPHGYIIPEENCHNYGRLPDFIPHSGVVSMDNPEYILQEAKRRGVSNYNTLGIPVVPSPTSSNGPSSLPAPPYTSLSSTGSGNYAAVTSSNNPTQTGLNGAIFNGNAVRAGSNGSHPRSSDGESDHEYYNDVDRLKREMQPLQQQPRNETTV
jgi:L1 cell adhesion molecule